MSCREKLPVRKRLQVDLHCPKCDFFLYDSNPKKFAFCPHCHIKLISVLILIEPNQNNCESEENTKISENLFTMIHNHMKKQKGKKINTIAGKMPDCLYSQIIQHFGGYNKARYAYRAWCKRNEVIPCKEVV